LLAVNVVEVTVVGVIVVAGATARGVEFGAVKP
jgi:hypothetical protein